MSENYTLVCGDDDFEVRRTAAEVMAGICGPDLDGHPDLEIIKGDAEDKTPDEIILSALETLKTPPFLSPRKTVWIKHFQPAQGGGDDDPAPRAKTKAKGKTAAKPIDLLLEFIRDGVPSDITLVIDSSAVSSKSALCKESQSAGARVLCFEKKSAGKNARDGVLRLIKECLARRKTAADQDALQYLSAALGGGSESVSNEIDKVCAHAGRGNTVTLRDCEAVCCRTPEAASWALTEAVMARDLRGALAAVETMTEQMRSSSKTSSNPELAILGGVSKAFQELSKVRAALAEMGLRKNPGMGFFNSPGELKEKFPANFLLKMHPYRAFKLCKSAFDFSDSEIVAATRDILEINRRFVSGGTNPRIELERLVVKICGGRV